MKKLIVILVIIVGMNHSNAQGSDVKADMAAAMGAIGLAEDAISLGLSVDYLVYELSILYDNVEMLEKDLDFLVRLMNIEVTVGNFGPANSNMWNNNIRKHSNVIKMYGKMIKSLLTKVRNDLTSYLAQKSLRDSTDPVSVVGVVVKVVVKVVAKVLKKAAKKLLSAYTLGTVNPVESPSGLKNQLDKASTKYELSISMRNIENQIINYTEEVKSINNDLHNHRIKSDALQKSLISGVTLFNMFSVKVK